MSQPKLAERRGTFFVFDIVPNVALQSEVVYNYFMYYVYILQLRDKTYYHGFSDDLKQRIKAHQDGGVLSTKNLRPLKLIYYSAFESKLKALQFEKYLKTNSGFAFRNKRLI